MDNGSGFRNFRDNGTRKKLIALFNDHMGAPFLRPIQGINGNAAADISAVFFCNLA